MTHLRLIFTSVILLLVFSCNNDDESENILPEIGILGTWEISNRGINNVSSLEALCCETIEFIEDNTLNDLKGDYIYINGTTTNGTFTLNLQNQSITFVTESNTTNEVEFSIHSNTLEVSSFEGDDRYWTLYSKLNN